MFMRATLCTADASTQPPTAWSTAPPIMMRLRSARRSTAAAMSIELVAMVSSASSGRYSTSARAVLPLSRNSSSPRSISDAAVRASAALRSRAASMRAAIGAHAGVTGSAPP